MASATIPNINAIEIRRRGLHNPIRWSSFVNQRPTAGTDLWPPVAIPSQHNEIGHLVSATLSNTFVAGDAERSMPKIEAIDVVSIDIEEERDSLRSLQRFVHSELGLGAFRQLLPLDPAASGLNPSYNAFDISNTFNTPNARTASSIYSTVPTLGSAFSPQFTRRARARFAYDGNESNPQELSFRKCEVLEVRLVTENWWIARNSRAETGIAPSNFLELLDPEASADVSEDYGGLVVKAKACYGKRLGKRRRLKRKLCKVLQGWGRRARDVSCCFGCSEESWVQPYAGT